MRSLLHDLRYAVRILAKTPGFTAVAILTLALGIGANTAIFSVVNATLLAPLPFKNPSQLVNIHAHSDAFDFWNLGLSLPDIRDIRAQSKSFSAIIPFEYANVDLSGQGAPQEVHAAKIPADSFSMLGIKPILGRAFSPSETQVGADRVAILSGSLWRTQFGSDPHLIGKTITLDEKPYIIIGVMPEMRKVAFSPALQDIWIPFTVTDILRKQRAYHFLPVIARLKPGVTLRQAQAELDGVATRLAKAYPDADKGWGFRVDSLRSDTNRYTRTPMLILLGAVGFVLLIACANVGNLFLSRGLARRRELAVRATLGATRGRLVRQLMTESTLLALAGGGCGLLLAWWLASSWKVETIAGTAPSSSSAVAIDSRVLLFTLGVAILAGLLFGLAPAFLSSRHDLATAMKEGSAGSQTGASGAARNPLRQILVVSEIALALVLVIGATLALRSFAQMLRVNLGFDTEHVLAVHLDFPETKFKNSDQMRPYADSLLNRLRAAPGIEFASLVGNATLSGSQGEAQFSIEGVPENSASQITAEWAGIGPEYFKTLGIPILRGRGFTEMDEKASGQAVIVNRAFAQKFLGGANPIGKRVWLGDEDAKHNRIWKQIVGESGDVRDINPRSAPRPEIYAPLMSSLFTNAGSIGIEVLLRTRANPEAMIATVRSQIWGFDKDQPISQIQSMQQRLAISVALPRFQVLLLGAFGGLGLLLAVIGIYGVISYTVTQRTHEIGIRMALGAEPKQVLRLVLGQGLKLAIIGVGIGIAAALGLTRLMSSLLFGVSATDPLTFAGVAVVLVAVALAACYLPARRAMRVDPMVALRYE